MTRTTIRPPKISPPRPAPPTALLLAWSLFIVYGTLLPFNFRFDPAAAAVKFGRAWAAFRLPTSRSDVASNVLLFLPWGLLYAWRGVDRGRTSARIVAGAALGGLALSGLVELAQLFLPSRTTSAIDLMTNTAGSLVGAVAGLPFARRVWPRLSPRLRHFTDRRPLAAFAFAAAAWLAVAGLSPFDVSIEGGDLKAAVKSARLVPFGATLGGTTPAPEPWTWAREGLTWSLAGGLFVLALRESGTGGWRAITLTAALCGGMGLAIEAAQLAIPGRVADATSALLAAAGASAGATIVATSRPRDPRRWVGPALACWAATALLAAWTPPHLAPEGRWPPRWSQLVPFWNYYLRTDLQALADLIDQVLAFLPLGTLLAIRDPRHAVRRSFLIGLGVGLVLESGQLALADRTADITDALSAAGGASLGARLWQLGCSSRQRDGGHARYRVR